MYARPGFWRNLDPRQRHLHLMRTISYQHPDWTFCHASAAVAYGLPVSWGLLKRIDVVTGESSHTRDSSLVRRHRMRINDVPWEARNLRVTTPARTIFDFARGVSFPDAVSALDASRRMGMIDDSFDDYLHEHAGARGIRNVRRAFEFSNPLAESGGESIARAVMDELRFEIPELQVSYRDPIDGRLFRGDYTWRVSGGLPILGELDGGLKYDDPEFRHGQDLAEVIRRERLRESRLTYVTSSIARFSFSDVHDRERFGRILSRAGVPRR
jgi:hypothetical protein